MKSISELAKQFGVSAQTVRRIFDSMPRQERCGRNRVVNDDDVPELAARAAGEFRLPLDRVANCRAFAFHLDGSDYLALLPHESTMYDACKLEAQRVGQPDGYSLCDFSYLVRGAGGFIVESKRVA